MSTQDNIKIVEAFFAAIGQADEQGLAALCTEDIAWIIPGEWALAGTHRGHAGLMAFLRTASETVETSTSPHREFVAEGDRVIFLGTATGRIKATGRTFDDHFVFSFTLRNGKVAAIREYIDTLALAHASETAIRPG